MDTLCGASFGMTYLNVYINRVRIDMCTLVKPMTKHDSPRHGNMYTLAAERRSNLAGRALSGRGIRVWGVTGRKGAAG